jgi:recombination protein RecR
MSVEALERLAVVLARLPGIGRKTAERMAMRLVEDPDGLLRMLVAALETAGAEVRFCGRCGAVTTVDRDPCRLCTDPAREDRMLCVVESPADIEAVERAGAFRGRYHALMGKISPMRGEGPDHLRVGALLKRVKAGGIDEILLALNTDVESDGTAAYLADVLRPLGVAVSRLAYGLPAGSGIIYADPVTLSRAIRGRQREQDVW